VAPNRQRAEREGRGWIVPILAALVLGAAVFGLLLGGLSLGAEDDPDSGTGEPVATTTAETDTEPADGGDDADEGTPTAVIAGPPQAIARHAQRYWAAVLQEEGRDDFESARVRGFSDRPRTECETAAQTGGPFYCDDDATIYLQTDFLTRLPPAGQAYVVAHLVAHHVQAAIGLTEALEARQLESGREEAARLGVAYELQADCFTGVWAAAAEADGVAGFDDLERMLERVSTLAGNRLDPAGPQLRPEIFAHAPATSRALWFERGRDTEDPALCTTYQTDVG
jgi:hypothetical protein